jgi:hypothetical protein
MVELVERDPLHAETAQTRLAVRSQRSRTHVDRRLFTGAPVAAVCRDKNLVSVRALRERAPDQILGLRLDPGPGVRESGVDQPDPVVQGAACTVAMPF